MGNMPYRVHHIVSQHLLLKGNYYVNISFFFIAEVGLYAFHSDSFLDSSVSKSRKSNNMVIGWFHLFIVIIVY